MNDYNRCNKVTGVHWLTKPIANLKIKIHLKQQNGMALPHFLNFNNDPNTSLQQVDEVKEYSFKWQQKVFSAWELQRYADVHNCITDAELNYHDVIKKLYFDHSKVFTYIHDDNYMPNPKKENVTATSVNTLNSCMQRLNLNGTFGRFVNEETVSMGHLFKSEENIPDDEKWTSMHVVLDNSDCNDDSQLLLKQEATLLSLYYNINQNYLIARPDVNNLEWNPYTVETSTGVQWNYSYSVRLTFEEEEDGEELDMLLKQLSKKWLRKNKSLLDFEMPPLGKKQYLVALEIISATDFEAKELYIEFYVKIHAEPHASGGDVEVLEHPAQILKLFRHYDDVVGETKYPESISHNDIHHGRTHVTSALAAGDAQEWYYSHLVELCLETDVRNETPSIQFFFELISTDWWGRHRTEGYAYIPISLTPGLGSKVLNCVRPEEKDRTEAETRRFFIGGCHLLRDLEILTKPKMQDSNFRYVSSGSLTLRWSTLLHSQVPGAISSTPTCQQPVSSASALLEGAEAVLKQYKKARARLAAATRDLRGETSSGHVTHDGSGDR